MGVFAQQLLTEHPKEASQAYVPLVSLLEELLDEAGTAGAIRSDLPNRRVAGARDGSTFLLSFRLKRPVR